MEISPSVGGGARALHRQNKRKTRTTSTLISTALGEFRMDAAMTAPCSVKANGR
jgi:hypothetical protein